MRRAPAREIAMTATTPHDRTVAQGRAQHPAGVLFFTRRVGAGLRRSDTVCACDAVR